MEIQGLLAGRTPRGRQHGGGRRVGAACPRPLPPSDPPPGPCVHGGSDPTALAAATRRRLLLRGPEDGGGRRREKPPPPPPLPGEGEASDELGFPGFLMEEKPPPPPPPPPAAGEPGPGAAPPAGPDGSGGDSFLVVFNLVRGGGEDEGREAEGPAPKPKEAVAAEEEDEDAEDAGGWSRGCNGRPGPAHAPRSRGLQAEPRPLPELQALQLLPGPAPDGRALPAEGFSGTITINNQNLIVRIENGFLTLAAPGDPLGPVGAKEAAAGGPGLGPGPQALPEEQDGSQGAALCAVDPADLGLPDPVANFLLPEPGDPLGKAPEVEGANPGARKGGAGGTGVVLVYHCPEPNCPQTFSKKHQLKLHLLSHSSTQGQRPFKCSLDGCGWAFTTSYKLKRHLQSHDKLRPFTCPTGDCGKRFTTVYNLKAHMKGHEQENTFKCEVCAERFPSHAKLCTHQRTHFEPERPYKCEFPGCEKTFITVSALFSHNRAHFREQELFSCSFPGCDKQYDKACRLKIHLRSHTGERPFICDFDGCGWSFTSMSKLLRHKRKHEDDRRFTCTVEGCGKSFTRAEHLKGHSITHLGTKPFECPVEGCCAKFSARSSLYIHSKKHLQDVDSLKSRCLVSSCSKLFTSKHSMTAHMIKQHNFSPDLLTQLEATTSLTPSSELTSPGQNDLSNVDLVSLFNVSGNGSTVATDVALVNSGILTIDVASVSSTLGGNLPVNNNNNSNSLGQTVDPLILVASNDNPHGLDNSLLLGTTATVLQQSTLNLDDVQTVNAEALGSLASLSLKNSSQDLHGLTSSNNLTIDSATLTPSSSLSGNCVPELLTPTKSEQNLLPGSDVVGQQEGSKVVTQFVFSNPTGSYSAQKEMDLSTVTGSSFLESGGSARTDYRAIQLAKKKKQRGTGSSTGASGSAQRKSKSDKVSTPSVSTGLSCRLSGSIVVPSGGLMIRDPATGAQYVQIQLLQGESTILANPAFKNNPILLWKNTNVLHYTPSLDYFNLRVTPLCILSCRMILQEMETYHFNSVLSLPHPILILLLICQYIFCRSRTLQLRMMLVLTNHNSQEAQ
ncbi:zinc finger X-linked protein ZXDB-like [Tachyglossus aculeatus]|uniref:zinc finger X-linked protein ZXDB-like n=1 Tax=Tachyglossus aculeatus TaxID=9261 RepID=UPI0018F4CD41|nr:zinc finger X-linked protein ZXDB-like [Tachyglossus aculeatus]